jgi:hypothetical protein
MTLAAMQRDFRALLVDAPNDMQRRVAPGSGLGVYHNAYRVQLADCLRETFEKVFLWLGEDAFLVAARTHIERTPPHGWTLGIYGAGFERTLEVLYPDDPEVAELAWLDWTLCRAFDGFDAVPMSPDSLRELDWDQTQLELAPTLQLCNARTNAGAIWSALSAGNTPPAAAALPTPGAMLVWRQGLTPCFRTIETIERDALAMLLAGETFGAVCTMLVERLGQDAGIQQAGAMLGQWLHDGLIGNIIVNN